MGCSTKGFYRLFLLAVSIFVFGVAVAAAQEVRVGAGAAPTENIFTKIKGPMESATGLRLILVSNGPVAAMKDLDRGAVDAATGGVAFGDWMDMMEKEGYRISNRDAYQHCVIGKDIIKVITHKDVSVAKLSAEQLKLIFTGKIDNWKDVGGPDLTVVVVMGSGIPGTNNVFQKMILGDEPYTKQVAVVTTAAGVKDMVSKTPGAVGLAPIALMDAAISAPVIPEVGRPITLITKGSPSSAVAKMIKFINGEGQRYVIK